MPCHAVPAGLQLVELLHLVARAGLAGGATAARR